MNILMSSYVFYPSRGGIEHSSLLLAREFSRAGHNVKLLTSTVSDKEDNFNYDVFRRPSNRILFKLASWSDLFFQNGISLRLAWPAGLQGKPWIASIQNRIGPVTGKRGLMDELKIRVLKSITAVSVSQALALDTGLNCRVIPNPYDPSIFSELPDVSRERDLVYLGRLIPEKGVDIFLNALLLLRKRGLSPSVTIIGDGPDRDRLERISALSDLSGTVKFAGAMSGKALAMELNDHKISVTPSRAYEAYPLSVIESIACGCVMAGSDIGGVKEAIGPCGAAFPPGNPKAMAETLYNLLADENIRAGYRSGAQEHLKAHTAKTIADEYLELFEGELLC